MECTSETCKGEKCSRSSKRKDGSYGLECHQHKNSMKYKNSDFHLIHGTDFKSFQNILKSGALLPLSESKVESNYGIEEFQTPEVIKEYNKSVFTALVFPVGKKGRTSFYPDLDQKKYNIYLIFSVKLLELISNHWCNYWQYGIFDQNCVKYNQSKSLNWNLNNLRDNFSIQISEDTLSISYYPGPHLYGYIANEIVFKGKIPLEYLEYIYVDKKYIKIKEIRKLAKQYPQYPWVFKNPFKPYKISLEKMKIKLYSSAEGIFNYKLYEIDEKFRKNPNHKCGVIKRIFKRCNPEKIKREMIEKEEKLYKDDIEAMDDILKAIEKKIKEAK